MASFKRCKMCGRALTREEGKTSNFCPECMDAKRHKLPNIASIKNPPTCTETQIALEEVQAEVLAKQMAEKKGLFSTQDKIKDILGGMCDLLLYKNQKYGDSALKPKNVFYKGDATNSILIRLDDKIGRVTTNPDDKPRVNDVADIIGYCVLLLISMGVTREDLAKFMD